MKQKIYLDTSVFGGYFDEEFKEHTVPLFDRIRNGDFILLFSIVTENELEFAPAKVHELVKGVKADISEMLYTTEEMIALASVIRSSKSRGPNKLH